MNFIQNFDNLWMFPKNVCNWPKEVKYSKLPRQEGKKKRGNKTNMEKCLLLIFLHNQQQETGNIGYVSFVHFTVWGPFFAGGVGRKGGRSEK